MIFTAYQTSMLSLDCKHVSEESNLVWHEMCTCMLMKMLRLLAFIVVNLKTNKGFKKNLSIVIFEYKPVPKERSHLV